MPYVEQIVYLIVRSSDWKHRCVHKQINITVVLYDVLMLCILFIQYLFL